MGALTCVSESKSDRQRRQLSAIAELTADIRHIAGPTNVGCARSSEAPLSIAAAGDKSTVGTGFSSPPAVSGSGLVAPSYAEVVKGWWQSQVGEVTTRAAAATAAATCSYLTALVDIGQIAKVKRDCPDCLRLPVYTTLWVLMVQMGGQEMLVDTSSGVMLLSAHGIGAAATAVFCRYP
jgi:hypothetical protein